MDEPILCPSPCPPPSPSPSPGSGLFSTFILGHTMVHVPLTAIIVWNLDVSCSALLVSWGDWTVPPR